MAIKASFVLAKKLEQCTSGAITKSDLRPDNGAEIVANSLVLMSSADYARQICGAGSQLARMVEAYRQTDPFGELYVIAVPESTGAAATVTLTVTGVATETGTVNVCRTYPRAGTGD